MEGPDSSYPSLEIHIYWKVEKQLPLFIFFIFGWKMFGFSALAKQIFGKG
jgi:hypothetical protein